MGAHIGNASWGGHTLAETEWTVGILERGQIEKGVGYVYTQLEKLPRGGDTLAESEKGSRSYEERNRLGRESNQAEWIGS